MDPLTAFISSSVIGLLMIIGFFIIIIPFVKNQIDATGTTNKNDIKIVCPNNATTIESKYIVPHYPGCFCKVGSVLNTLTNRCDLCPAGATSLETNIPINSYPGCYCTVGSRWDTTTGTCLVNPFGSSEINTGITTNIDGIYCLPNRYWNSNTKKCEACPSGSGTSVTNIAAGGYTGCYCTSGKLWDNTLEVCETGICDGHGSIQNGSCTCDQGYYLYNGTYCTLCNNGTKTGSTCTCPAGTSFSGRNDGCIT